MTLATVFGIYVAGYLLTSTAIAIRDRHKDNSRALGSALILGLLWPVVVTCWVLLLVPALGAAIVRATDDRSAK